MTLLFQGEDDQNESTFEVNFEQDTATIESVQLPSNHQSIQQFKVLRQTRGWISTKRVEEKENELQIQNFSSTQKHLKN